MSRDVGPPGNGTVERAVLSVPPVERLSVAQTCGRACVWCAVVLTTETAVELGVRSEGGFTWFPRGCRLCASRPAYLALLAHIQSCEQCADDPARCAVGHALRQTLKEARR
ncbi:hypothetical protein GCM10009837_23250 [Streptomyces durmitorensis]|uniref:Uncharacterized protein n=1 Tax=Streptomyces durmitorensis TaxID=319947 RepID=A0ABY4PMM3_9ACTN|nr:hypothetical protein [Streptomyces durmitorensis]UQT55052.1 hypothetical protein M4V62_08055 [Streptomyces durmitorensis]